MLLALTLGACSLTPEFSRPAAPVAAAYPAPSGLESGRAASEIGWRQFFPDARLQALIAASLEHNRDLRTAALRVEEARALYNVQSADLLPTINAVGSAGRSRTPPGASPLGRPVVTANYQIGLSLAAFELDFFGRVRSLSDAALSQFLATEEAQRSAHISLVAAVARAYLAERAYAEQLTLAQDTKRARDAAMKLARQRFDVGASSGLDLRQAESLYQSAQVAELALARLYAQSINALTLLVGQPLENLPPARKLEEQGVVADIPAGLPSDLLARRPDIRAAEQRLRATNANIGAARAAFFPRISLTSGIGLGSNDLSTLFEGASRSWSFVPQLTLPLFDAGRNSSNLSLAQARNNLAVVDYERTIQTAFREVADALVARELIDQQIQAQGLAVQAQADRARLSELRYRNGIASSLEVLDAQRELFATQQLLIQSWQLRFTNAVDLYRSLGGGLLESGQQAAASPLAPPPVR
ncbi:efflux transporter outer membrane subunit [Lacisediminimonas sp.]|uniref:efflux transporter outer membrane subunit n=1 Tax=Lacisediminimonas sp. TaxID=3060582 RepID=UPI00271F38EF|nr:efflux transporter outer membrane subunit [Lacisediminimonas sp.]MDO8298525.1 efflux transporter outer membrane subunit [Lacisediminimonas sp.]